MVDKILLIAFRIATCWIYGLNLHKPLKRIPVVRILVCRGEIIWRGDRFQGKLFVAFAGHGRHYEVKLFICARIPVNSFDEIGNTALIAAARAGHTAIVDCLLAHPKIDVNARNNDEDTALILAFSNKRWDVAKQLLAKNNTDVNAQNRKEENALFWATCLKQYQIKKELECKGALDPDLKKKVALWKLGQIPEKFTGDCFLQRVREGHWRRVALFCRAEIDPYMQDTDHNTALLIACSNNDRKMVRLTLCWNRINVNASNLKGDTALIVAAKLNDPAIAKSLLRGRSVNVNSCNHEGDTALIVAARYRMARTVELLLDRSELDVNARNRKGESALLWAARLEEDNIVRMLVARGASEANYKQKTVRWQLEQKNIWSDEHFVQAVNRRKLRLVQQFLFAGMDPNARDNKGYTGLIIAARNGFKEIVELFLRQPGVDIAFKASDETTALQAAAARKNDGIVKLLHQSGATEDRFEAQIARRRIRDQAYQYDARTFVAMALKGQLDMVHLFLDAGMNPDAKNDVGDTPLIASARSANYPIVKLMLERGANANECNRFGFKALDEAEKAGSEQIIELLRDNGAQRSEVGDTRIIRAIEEGQIQDIEAALQQGASANSLTAQGTPALVLAVRRDLPEFVRRLLERGARAKATDQAGMNAILCAADLNSKEIITILLEYQPDLIKTADRRGRTALIIAAEKGHKAAVEALLEGEANRDAMDEAGRTALIAARQNDELEIVELLDDSETGYTRHEETLLTAVRRRDVIRVKELISNGVDLNETDVQGNAALSIAAARGWNDVLQVLLEASEININHRNEKRDTPLMLAARAGHHQTVLNLLDHEPCPELDAINKKNETALFQAAASRRGRILRLLAEAGADVNMGSEGTSPLIEACDFGPRSSVEALLEFCADVNIKVRDGFSPLMTATCAGRESIVKLLKNEKVGAYYGSKEARLFLAARRGSVEDLETLISGEVDINARDRRGRTALMEAAEHGHSGVVQMLLECKDGAILSDRQQATALKLSARQGQATVLRILLEKIGRDEAVETQALLEAVEHNHPQVVRLLCESKYKAKKNGLKQGRVPLVVAASRGHLQVVRALLDVGVDINRKASSGQSALEVAIMHNHHEIADLLISQGAEAKTGDIKLLAAAHRGDAKEVRRLLFPPIRANPEACDNSKRSVLMHACRSGSIEVVKILFKRLGKKTGICAVEKKDSGEMTPLMWATMGGEVKIVRLLVNEYQASISECSKKGRTALMEACRYGHPAIVRFLLDKLDSDADRQLEVSTQDRNKRTPLSETLMKRVANRSEQYDEIAALLMKYGAKCDRKPFELLNAARLCKLAELSRLVSEMPMNELRFSGKDALMLAADAGCEQGVKVLLEAGADVEAKSDSGETAMLLAARRGHWDIVIRLLKSGADCNASDSAGRTSLLEAVESSKLDAVRDLLMSGADINRQDRSGRNALMRAVYEQDEPLVDLLLAEGGQNLELDLFDFDHRTALNIAHLKQLARIEDKLVSNGAKKGLNEAKLVRAADAGKLQVVQSLLGETDVNVPDLEGETALLKACRWKNPQMARALLRAGANADLHNASNRSPLMEAAKTANLELLEILLQVDPMPDLDLQDDYGTTALLEAAKTNQDKMVASLTNAGANVNAANKDGETPLTECAKHPWTDTVRTLLDLNANACARTKGWRTPIIESAARGHSDILKMLLERVESKLFRSTKEYQVILNAVDRNKKSALHYAEKLTDKKCADLLLQYGAEHGYACDDLVYITQHGDCWHYWNCGSLAHGKRHNTLEPLFHEEVPDRYDICGNCHPYASPIKWSC